MTCIFLNESDGAEVPPRGVSCLIARHTALLKLFCFEVEVCANLALDLTVPIHGPARAA